MRELSKKWGIKDIGTVRKTLEVPPLNVIRTQGAITLVTCEVLAVDTGLPPNSDLFTLEWTNVHTDASAEGPHGHIHVPGGKTDAARRNVPLTPRAKDVLEARRAQKVVGFSKCFPALARAPASRPSNIHTSGRSSARIRRYQRSAFRNQRLNHLSSYLERRLVDSTPPSPRAIVLPTARRCYRTWEGLYPPLPHKLFISLLRIRLTADIPRE